MAKFCNAPRTSTKRCCGFSKPLAQYLEPRPRPRRPVAHIAVQPVPLRMPFHERLSVERSPAWMPPTRRERHVTSHFAVDDLAVVGAPRIERPVVGAAEARVVQFQMPADGA